MMMNGRFDPHDVSDGKDKELDGIIRPQDLKEFTGQDKIIANLKVFVKAAKLRGESLDHVLFHGPPGLGKTTLAHIIANELGVGLKVTSGPILDKPRKIYVRYVREGYDGENRVVVRMSDRIDLREQVYDYPKQGVITKDNVTISIDALLYFQINNAADACYEVANLTKAIEMLTQTTLRNVIGKLTLDECLTSRDDINKELCLILDEATDKWGVKVNRVEVKDIDVPESIRNQMEKQMSAERDQRAMVSIAEGEKKAKILEAEGFKTSEINKAEGDKQASILRAEGEAEARKLRAEAEAAALEKIKEVFGSNEEYYEYLRAIRYIDAMKDIFSGKDTKTIFMPYETEKTLASLGAIGEILKENRKEE